MSPVLSTFRRLGVAQGTSLCHQK